MVLPNFFSLAPGVQFLKKNNNTMQVYVDNQTIQQNEMYKNKNGTDLSHFDKSKSALGFDNNYHLGNMVLIPAGDFEMGSNEGNSEEKPAHKVYLDAFYIDLYEVTNGDYAKCISENKCTRPDSGGGFDLTEIESEKNVPVLGVTWDQANDYCIWMKKRLPTEAEWEKAARGTDSRKYPWGNEPISCDLANTHNCAGRGIEVGSYPNGVSPYGLFDMAGNASEWVADWYDSDYYRNSPYENPLGPTSPKSSRNDHVIRGGSWDDYHTYATTYDRSGNIPLRSNIYKIGFRCATAQK